MNAPDTAKQALIGAGTLYEAANMQCPADSLFDEGWPELQPLPPKYPAPPQMDPDVLPSTLAPYVADCAARMQIPAEMIATPLIVALGSVLGKKAAAQPKGNDPSWYEYGSFWSATVAPPGFLKSPSIAAGTRHIQELDDAAMRRYGLLRIEWESDERVRKLEAEKRLSDAKKAIGNGDRLAAKLLLDANEDVKPPTRTRYIIQDTTPEARLEILAENPNGCMQLFDEMDTHIAQLRKDGFEAARGQELQFFDGKQDYTTDRIKRGSSVAEGPRLSMNGGLQPAKIEKYLRDIKNGGNDDGYIQRVLQLGIQPSFSADYTLTDSEPNHEADEQVRAIFKAADDMPLVRDELTGRIKPRILKFNAEAQALFNTFLVNLENRIRSGKIGGAMMASHAGKYRGTLPKLALLLALAENPAAVSINKVAFDRAYALLNFYLAHAKRIYAVETRGDIVSAHELLARIKKGQVSDGFNPRDDVMRREWAGLTKAGETEGAIAVLVAHGYLREVVTETHGRPRRLLVIHPDLLPDKSDKTSVHGEGAKPPLLSGAP